MHFAKQSKQIWRTVSTRISEKQVCCIYSVIIPVTVFLRHKTV